MDSKQVILVGFLRQESETSLDLTTLIQWGGALCETNLQESSSFLISLVVFYIRTKQPKNQASFDV